MSEIFATGIMGILWIVNLFNGTGLDQVYHVTDIFKYIIIGLSIIVFFFHIGNKEKRSVESSKIAIFGGTLIVFITTAALNGFLDTTIDYVWVFLLIFLIAELKISSKAFAGIGFIFGVLGALVLVIYNYGSLFIGWNENSIAMLGMHSYLMFLIPFYKKNKNTWNFKNTVLILTTASIFAYLLKATNCRSGTLFLIIAVFFYLNLVSKNILIGNKKRIFIALFIPLFIAVAVAVISTTPWAETLNTWSLEKFQKPIFNGRDTLWIDGFKILKDNFFFGTGDVMMNNWHNSAITCLTAYGSVGFVLWIKSFHTILGQAKPLFNDYLVVGSAISFLIIYIQQSVELGFISSAPSFIPYIMLGLMLGRVNYLKSNSSRSGHYETKCNYSHL